MRWQDLAADGNAAIKVAAITDHQDLFYTEAVALAAFQAMGLSVQFAGIQIERPEFSDCVQHLHQSGFRGIFVLNPFKVDAARVAERFWVARFALGVANCLFLERSVFAQNTEVPAISACVRGIEPGAALVMGTGHAARSVIAGLLDSGFKVRAWNRNANKTRILKTLLERYGDLELLPNPDPSGCKLIVNATPLGLKVGEEPPLIWSRVRPNTTCFDLVFRRVPTDFLRNAKTRGLRAIDGRQLLVEQTALAIEWWTGQPVPREPMLQAIGLKTPTVGV